MTPRRRQLSRQPRARGVRPFEKPPLSIDALVDQLGRRGLIMPDPIRATRYVRQVGYFRLSPYTIPFQEQPRTSDHRFKRGTEFDDVLDLYVFDRTLRLLVMDALERVEVAIRAAVTDYMATTYEDAHWYTTANHFEDAQRHKGLIEIVQNHVDAQLRRTAEQEGSSEAPGIVFRSALEHYVTTYGDPRLPPSWLMVEMLTLGQLDDVFRNLKSRIDKESIARSLGLNETILGSWMRTYVRIRNVCAHHGRLWNVGIGVYPKIPTSRRISWLEGGDALPASSEKRLYPILVSLQSVLDVVSPRSTWARRLYELISTRPAMNLRGMGVPDRWMDDQFWARHLT